MLTLTLTLTLWSMFLVSLLIKHQPLFFYNKTKNIACRVEGGCGSAGMYRRRVQRVSELIITGTPDTYLSGLWFVLSLAVSLAHREMKECAFISRKFCGEHKAS